MRTPYGKLAWLALVMIAAFMLFMPMRSGVEDRLYADPAYVSMHRGDTYAIQYHLQSRSEQSVDFVSTNENIAKVNSRGVVTAVSAGTASIRMLSENGARGQLRVEVVGNPVTTLALSAARLNMEKGEVTGLKAIFNEGADAKLVEWLSADERIARVDTIGRVYAVGGGSTRIVASTPGGLTASCEVNVHVPATAVHLTPDTLTVGVGTVMNVGVTFFPDDATDTIANWSSSDPGVINMNADGSLHAIAEGTATISAFTSSGMGGSTVVTVERSASSFELSPAAATIERGDTIKLNAMFTNEAGRRDDDSSGHYIQWVSSNPQVATVEDGFVRALSSGTTRIMASADGMTAECNLRVQVLVHEINFNANSIYLLREQTASPIQLTPEIYPVDADNQQLTYSSSNELVATVDANGLVTLTGGYGTAFISATAEGGAQADFIVNVVTTLPDDITLHAADGSGPIATDESAPEGTSETPSAAGIAPVATVEPAIAMDVPIEETNDADGDGKEVFDVFDGSAKVADPFDASTGRAGDDVVNDYEEVANSDEDASNDGFPFEEEVNADEEPEEE